MSMQVLGFSDYKPPGQRLAEVLGVPYGTIARHRFPDGESLIRLPLPLPETVIVCRTLNRPNSKLVELMLTAETARSHGVKRLILVAPYLAYQRQDMAFHPGESISQRIVGLFLARCFDELITVDPHLHRVHSLGESVPCRRAIQCTAAALMADFVQRHLKTPLLVGPDIESDQWVGSIAAASGLDYVVATKVRHGDRSVRIQLPDVPLSGRHTVLVDDVVSTGATVATAAGELRRAGARSVDCLVTHCLLTIEAENTLRRAGIDRIWSSDSVLHPSNAIELAPVLAKAVVE